MTSMFGAVRLPGHPTGDVHGTDTEREPPPPATVLDFPQYQPPAPVDAPFTKRSKREIAQLYGPIKKLDDLTPRHVEILNVSFTRDVALDELIPEERLPNGQEDSFLPPPAWDHPTPSDPPSEDTTPPRKLCNGRDAPGEALYRQRAEELAFDNDDAFRAILRESPRPGRPRVKPGQYYKFWQGLETMSQWWDTSLDDYAPEGPNADAMEVDGESDKASSDTKRRQPGTYKGRRVGTGRDFPDTFREDTIRTYVETAAWLFGCQVVNPRSPPRLTVQTLLIPVRLTHHAFRSCADRFRARQGHVEGPVLGVQCRHETVFRAPSDAPGHGSTERLDLLRQVGAMLLLAQERRREGRVETKPGAGQWWTTVPRWGGGAGGDVGNTAGNSDEIPGAASTAPPPARPSSGSATKRLTEELNMRKRGSADLGPTGVAKTRTRRESAADAYKRLACGSGVWDPKVTYQRIGRESGSSKDDVFLVSSINHHISLLRLSVSDAYLAFIETGALPAPSQALRPDWAVPRLQQTRWFDLFSPADRIESFRALWGIFGYQMRGRGTEPQAGAR